MKKILILIGIILLSLTACTTQPAAQPTPTTQPLNTQTLAPIKTPTITSTPEPALTPSTTPLTAGTLNQEGPWLMYQHADGTLYFVNLDGTGRTQSAIKIGKDDYVTTSPSGDVVAIGDFELTNDKVSIYLDIFKLSEITQLQHLDLYSYLLEHPQDDIQK